MKCQEIERLIYLLEELDEKEITFVNRHVASCPVCRTVFERRQKEKDAIRLAIASAPVQPPNAAQLTSRIMAAVQKEGAKGPSFLDYGFGPLFSRSLQYTLGAVSVFLALFFFTEYNQSLRYPPSPVSLSKSASVELNTTAFYREFGRMKRKGTTFSASPLKMCLQVCQKLSAEECSACKSKFNKINKQNETM